jgi:uncharacterized protein YciI
MKSEHIGRALRQMSRLSKVSAILMMAWSVGSLWAPAATNLVSNNYWVFLNRGVSQPSLDKETAQKMQADHIANLTRLGREGRALTAGPLGDGGDIRGIVILHLVPGASVSDCFTNDPFVENHRLVVESHPWLLDERQMHPPSEPFKLGQYSLGIVKRGANWKPLPAPLRSDSLESLMPVLKTLRDQGQLAVAAPMLDDTALVGTLLFTTTNRTALRGSLDADPSIQAGRLTVELHSQFLAKGVLDPGL